MSTTQTGPVVSQLILVNDLRFNVKYFISPGEMFSLEEMPTQTHEHKHSLVKSIALLSL